VDVATTSDAKRAADLVARIIAGDQQAEEELIERYTRGVTFILQRESRNVPVEDLRQDTFRIALEKIRNGDVREPERLSGFVASIARNLVIQYFRRPLREESLEEPTQLRDPAPSQLDLLLQKERDKAVRQVIKEIKSERDRQVLLRFYIAEEEKDKICADFGLSSLHFNRVLFRARKRFKELYVQAKSRK
jgi:RNA polymerase sigma-70 factor, ECF subfamily